MFGAIVGDIIGSVYEFNNIKTKDFPLFREDCFFTDDTVMTLAVCDAIMKGGAEQDFIDSYKSFGKKYPNAGYGSNFQNWLFSNSSKPYNSFGNGSAMRVSPCAWVASCGFYARTGIISSRLIELATTSAKVTHNHKEGINGALAVALCIYFGRFYSGGHEFYYGNDDFDSVEKWKRYIKGFIEKNFNYNLSKTVDEIRENYFFNETCQNTVPQAITCFLESVDFEDAIRNAVSIGGDTDTICAITGSIAEAFYGIPKGIKEKAYSYLDDNLKQVCNRWKEYIKN